MPQQLINLVTTHQSISTELALTDDDIMPSSPWLAGYYAEEAGPACALCEGRDQLCLVHPGILHAAQLVTVE